MLQNNLLSGFLILAFSLFLSGSALALSTDKDQPIEVEADSVDVNETEGISIYKGNVEINQGSIRLQAAKVTIHHPKGKSEKLVAVGNPVRFRQLPDNKKEYIKGRGKKVEYKINSETMYLSDNAVLIQGSNSFKSDRIVYDRVKAIVKAGTAAKGKKRVKMTIGR